MKHKTKKYKLLSLFVAIAMVFCMIPAVALAAEEGDVVKITNSQELIDAINNQKTDKHGNLLQEPMMWAMVVWNMLLT